MSVKEQLKSYILSKSISGEERKLGIEVECFIFDKNDNRIPVNNSSSFSASDLLKELESSSNGNYSLEPGGQIEWSSPPSYQLKDIERDLFEYKDSLDKILDREGFKSLYIGVDPFYNPSEIDLIDYVYICETESAADSIKIIKPKINTKKNIIKCGI